MNTQTPHQIQTTMGAAMFYGPGDVRMEEVPIPACGPDDVIMQVDTALTCGTDLKTYRRGHPVLIRSTPSGFGHECAGTVWAVGDNVTAYQRGDRIMAANSAPCMDCYFCSKTQYNLCENLDLLNGAYAQYLKIPGQIVRHNTHHIPDHVPFAHAAFCEPLAVSLRGIDMAAIKPGDHVGVIGLGPIGLLLIKAATLRGATVTAFGRSELKRQLAQTFGGAQASLNMVHSIDPDTIISEFTPEGRGFDVMIEAVGQPHLWELALAMTRKGGRVNLFGGCPGDTSVTLPTKRLHYDEITVVSSFHHTPHHVKQALDLFVAGTIDPSPLISDTMPLHCLLDAFSCIDNGQAIKIALKPNE